MKRQGALVALPWRESPGGDGWSFGELWWYGQVKVFAHQAEVAVRADDSSSFHVSGRRSTTGEASPIAAPLSWEDSWLRGPLYGVALDWPQRPDAPAGDGAAAVPAHLWAYDFLIRFATGDESPDAITVNDVVTWTRSPGGPFSEEVTFTYSPDGPIESLRICLIRRAGETWSRIRPLWRPRTTNVSCRRRARTSAGVPPTRHFLLPRETRFMGPDPAITLKMRHWEYLPRVPYERPSVPDLPHPGSGAVILDRSPDYATNGETNYLQHCGFLPERDFITYQPGGGAPFSTFLAKALAAGVRNLLITPIVRLEDGRYKFFHFRVLEADAHIEAMAEVMREWLRHVPDGKVYAFPPEVNGSFGVYKGGIGDSAIGRIEGYQAVGAGGPAAWRAAFSFYQDVWRRLRERLGEAGDRMKVVAQFDRAGFQGAYGYHLGADIVIHKNIHRQSINVVTANSRGAARAYGKEYGYDFDAWDRNYQYGYDLDEIRQGLMVYFHAGAHYLMDEIPGWMHPRRPYGTSEEGVNPWGTVWLDFLRYVNAHPPRGEQRVRIAVMRGLGDEWNRVAGPSSGWESAPWLPRAEMEKALHSAEVPAKWAKAARSAGRGEPPVMEDTYLWDYTLLNLVFAQYGLPYRTFSDRLATGTPYGPVDFIPWDTPLEALCSYSRVIFLGQGAVDAQTPETLEAYVEQGGVLVAAAGQLRNAAGQTPESFLGVRFAGVGRLDDLPYTRLVPSATGARVLYRLSNSDPLALAIRRGKGEAILFCTEWLNERGEREPVQALLPLLESAKWLHFSPASDWIEYLVRRKSRSWIFPIFNHGRGFFPSGNGRDHGPWKGEIGIDLGEIGLAGREVEVFRVRYEADAPRPFRLEAVEAHASGDRLAFTLQVDQFEEVIVGPKGCAEDDFFR